MRHLCETAGYRGFRIDPNLGEGRLRIGIDLMGSDTSPSILFEAVLQVAEQLDPTSSLIVLATQDVVDELTRHIHPIVKSAKTGRIIFHVAQEVITSGDDPLTAVRRKKNSSLVLGIRMLKKRQIDAFVSAGNTGALLTSASLSLPMLKGISRPGLLAVLPTQTGTVAIVDVGGNVSCKAHHLVQFAHMGAAYQCCTLGIELPKVGLLNIGVESKKGTLEVRQAYQMLQAYLQETAAHGLTPKMHFLGNIEGREVFQGKADVIVTDGFTGNVLLKTAEGVSSFIFGYLKEIYKQAPSERFIRVMNDLQMQFNYAEYPGAILCGVDGIVVKCHGHSSARAMFNGIRGAVHLVKKQFVSGLKEQLV